MDKKVKDLFGLLRMASRLVCDHDRDLLPRALVDLALAYPGTSWAILTSTANGYLAHTTVVSGEDVRTLARAANVTLDEVRNESSIFPFEQRPLWAVADGLVVGVWTDPGGRVPPTGAVELVAQLVARAVARSREVARLRHENAMDTLTEVYGRRAIFERLARESERAQRYGHALSVLYIDVDAFKRLNDTHGHHVGDHVLRAVAATLESAVRSSDAVGRVGGDEFLILLPHTDAQSAARVARHIESLLDATLIRVDGLRLGVRVTIGAASTEEGCVDLVELADRRMLQQKRRRAA